MSKILRFVAFMAAMLVTFSLYADDELTQTYEPQIIGSTLYIKGEVDSHIYDFLAREQRALKNVQIVELNSHGGNFDWGLLIGAKIRELNLTTHLTLGNHCESACVFIFAGGQTRFADEGSWFGIHGPRLNLIQADLLRSRCISNEKNAAACKKMIQSYAPILETSFAAEFAFLEKSGVSEELRDTYMALKDDSDWLVEANLLKKPDYVLSADEALQFGLVTRVLPVKADLVN